MKTSSPEREMELLYLFSSNISPQYEQDILNLLAYPPGLRYQFRYDRKYVNPAALELWPRDGLKDRDVLVHFSLQQAARYHSPVFFPVRRAIVTASETIGNDVHVVEFVLGDYVSLDEPLGVDGKPAYSSKALAYTKIVAEKVRDVPYHYSATLAPDVTMGLRKPGEDGFVKFERSVRYLRLTDSFREAWFFHVVQIGLRDPDQSQSRGRVEIENGTFSLQGGRTYELQILQRQPQEVSTTQPFSVSSDKEVLKVIGREGFDIASRYDLIRIPFHVADPEDGSRDTVLAIDPAVGSQGPVVRLPIRVRPSVRKAMSSVSTGAGLFIVGVAGAFPKSTFVSFLLILAAVAIHFLPRWTVISAGFQLKGRARQVRNRPTR
ncbi:MAG: hypothetical protein ACT4OM_09645 [Actinomycetota bacterium]